MNTQSKCLYCGQTDQQTPLVTLTYKGKQMWICSSHLPMLIHEPAKIASQLEEAIDSGD